jgi:hypothetical protein
MLMAVALGLTEDSRESISKCTSQARGDVGDARVEFSRVGARAADEQRVVVDRQYRREVQLWSQHSADILARRADHFLPSSPCATADVQEQPVAVGARHALDRGHLGDDTVHGDDEVLHSDLVACIGRGAELGVEPYDSDPALDQLALGEGNVGVAWGVGARRGHRCGRNDCGEQECGCDEPLTLVHTYTIRLLTIVGVRVGFA